MSSKIRVCTLNIWNYNDPWPTRRQLIANTITQHNPDIIGFQEIRHSGQKNENKQNQAQQLANLLPEYTYIYRPAQQNPEKNEWEGLAIFSRLPIQNSSFIKLSRDPNDNRDNHQRIVLRAQIQTPAGNLNFFNTHLSLSQQGRIRTTQEITAYVNQYSGDLPSILVGDFNDTPDRPAIQHITQSAQLIDTWAQQNPNDPGHTFSNENTYVREKNHDKRKAHRIDYIFAQAPKNNTGQAITCQRIADQPNAEDLYPSDHFGLIADFNLKGTP